MQMTLEGKLTLNAPRMESSKNWMLCWVSALHSFLHRKHKQEVKPSPERSATHQSHQELGDLLFFFLLLEWIWDFMLIMFYKSPWAGTALAVLSRGRHPREAARAVHTGITLQLSATAPASLLQHTAPFVNLHCSRMLPWQGRILSILNAIFFCKSLMLFSRNTGKIKYVWGWKICQDCRTVVTEKTQFLLCKCPVSSFLTWLIIHMMKTSWAFCVLWFQLRWQFSKTFLPVFNLTRDFL